MGNLKSMKIERDFTVKELTRIRLLTESTSTWEANIIFPTQHLRLENPTTSESFSSAV